MAYAKFVPVEEQNVVLEMSEPEARYLFLFILNTGECRGDGPVTAALRVLLEPRECLAAAIDTEEEMDEAA